MKQRTFCLTVDLSMFRQIGLTKQDIELIGYGHNAIVVRILSGEFSGNVAKAYYSKKYLQMKRASREFDALLFLNSLPTIRVPKPVRLFEREQIAILSSLPGVSAKGAPNAPKAMLDFASVLFTAYLSDSSHWRHTAVEACLSIKDIFSQILIRLDRISQVKLASRISELEFNTIGSLVNQLLSMHGDDLKFQYRTLSQSDFGPHNMLWNGREFGFVDFEYFGVDSVCRVILDVLWHPGTSLNFFDRCFFVDQAIRNFRVKYPLLSSELCSCLPLIGLRWAAIMLESAVDSVQKPNFGLISVYLGAIDNLVSRDLSLDDQIAFVAAAISP